MMYLLIALIGMSIGAVIVSWNTTSMARDTLAMGTNLTKQYERLVLEQLKAWRNTLVLLKEVTTALQDATQMLEDATTDLYEAIPIDEFESEEEEENYDGGVIGMVETPPVTPTQEDMDYAYQDQHEGPQGRGKGTVSGAVF